MVINNKFAKTEIIFLLNKHKKGLLLMKRFLTLVIVITISLGGCIKNKDNTNKMTNFEVNDYQWKNRIVIVFTDSVENSSYKSFRQQWDAQKGEVLDRDMILVEIFKNGQSFVMGSTLNKESQQNLIHQFEIGENSFESILIGKDGSIKLRSSNSFLNDLFSLIDTMPMRQAEIKIKKDQQ
jgi:hypothetical protein